MTEETTKELCTGGLGKWEPGKACPTDKRMSVCRSADMRSVYYDGYIVTTGDGQLGLQKRCTDVQLGKYAEVPKKK